MGKIYRVIEKVVESRRKLLLLTPALLIPTQADAQNPQCPTRPTGDSSNACASTAFVQNQIGTSVPLPLSVANGGTAASTVVGARTNLFAAPIDAAAYYGLSLNPGHEVSQANEANSVSISPSAGSVNPYLTDMHRTFAQSTTAFTATGQQVAGIFAGFPKVMKITITSTQASPAASDIFHINQFIEGYKAAKLALGTANAQQYTIVYIVQSSISNHILNISTANAGAENRNWVAKFTLAANTPTLCAFTVSPETSGTWNTGNVASIAVSLCLGAGSNYFGPANAWNTGVTQDATSDVTWMPATNGATFQFVGPFVFPGTQVPDITVLRNLVIDFIAEKKRCERYYWKTFLDGTVPAQNVGVNTGEIIFPALQAGATLSKSSQFLIGQEMRVGNGTYTIYNPSNTNAQVRDKTAAADCSGSAIASNASPKGFFMATTGAAGTAIGNTLAAHVTIDARM